MRTVFFLALLAVFSTSANAGDSRTCEERTHEAFPVYEQTSGSAERGPAVDDPNKPYSRAHGDYDGDGMMDTALLLRPLSEEGKYAISVCLSSRPTQPPELIQNAYTAGPISTTPKGREYYDFDTNEEHRYELDGIGSYCCDCCGATYIFRNGQFVEVIDSD